MKFDLEKYILNKINSKEWKQNEKIPTEIKFIEFTGMSKMTIRKIIERLKQKEALYSIQGKGVFVSPFYAYSKFERLSDTLGATKIICLPSSSKIPQVLLKKFGKKFEINMEKIITFVKLYFVKDEIIGFSLNWLNNKDDLYTLKKIIKKEKWILNKKDFDKVINFHKLEKTSSSDKNILLTSFEYIPTIYSYFIKKNKNIVMMRIAKIKPNFYHSSEIKNV